MVYNVRLIDLPETVRSFVKPNDDCSATIVINARLNHEQQCECYWHEVEHIEHDNFKQENVNEIETEAHERRKR